MSQRVVLLTVAIMETTSRPPPLLPLLLPTPPGVLVTPLTGLSLFRSLSLSLTHSAVKLKWHPEKAAFSRCG